MRIRLIFVIIILANILILPQALTKLTVSTADIKKMKISEIRAFTPAYSIKDIYKYDSEGYLKKLYTYFKADVVSERREYSYNNAQLAEEKIFTLFNEGSELVYSGRIEYLYNSDGLVEKVKEYSWGLSSNYNKLNKETFFEYNKNKEISKRIESQYSGYSSKEKQYLYEYDKINLLKNIKTKDNRGYSEMEYFTYDSKGKLTSKKYFYEIDNTIRDTREFKYNSDGLLIEEWSTHYSDNKPTLIIKYEYNFVN